jgi:hypothetical protein
VSDREHGDPAETSVFVPIAFLVFAIFCGFLFARQQQAVTKLTRQQASFCASLTADASTRQQQAVNALALQVAPEKAFDRKAEKVLLLFHKSDGKRTAAQKAGTLVFVTYIEAQVTQNRHAIVAQTRNIVLTQALAAKADRLAADLHC